MPRFELKNPGVVVAVIEIRDDDNKLLAFQLQCGDKIIQRGTFVDAWTRVGERLEAEWYPPPLIDEGGLMPTEAPNVSDVAAGMASPMPDAVPPGVDLPPASTTSETVGG